MAFRNFRFQIIFRVLLISLSITALILLLTNNMLHFTAALIGLTVVLQIVSLIRYVEKTNKKVTHLLESIRHSDFSTSFSTRGYGRNFNRLHAAFNEVIQEFNKTRSAEEEHFNYLQTVVQHVQIGIISYRKDGKVDLYNNAVKKLFHVTNLRYIHELENINKELPQELLKIKSGEKRLFKMVVNEEMVQLSVHATEFRLKGEEYILISLQNIYSELEEKEIESWQKLIRVLTHEIMNSITPISSLASTMQEMFLNDQGELLKPSEVDEETLESIQTALSTIKNRSQGLLNFVEIYRNLTRIPKPNFRHFEIQQLFSDIQQLLQMEMEDKNIQCTSEIKPDNLKITADPDLLEQVLINLLRNAIDALEGRENASISIRASLNSQSKVNIEVSDNGPGIKSDILEKIFVPFFTSKAQGSGIGLSLSRQIMHLHKGRINVKTDAEAGTTFILTF